MKFGLSFLPDAQPGELSPTEYFKSTLALCQYADQHDYALVKMTEHYLHSYGGYCPDPLIFLGAVASITQKIRLMTGCILPVFHHPITIAAKTALVDCISQGRLEVGFARAYLPYEFNAFGVPLNDSWERFSQTLLTVQRLWTEKNVCSSTPFFQFENATSLPECNQKPHPPIWGAAVNARQSYAWLGENGFNLLVTPPLDNWEYWQEKLEIYLDAFKSSQPAGVKPKIALSLPLLIDNDPNKAKEEGEFYLKGYLATWLSAVKKGQDYSADYIGYEYLVKAIQNSTAESMMKNSQAIVGTPEIVIDKLLYLKELNMLDYVLWQIDYGAQPYERSLRTLQLFDEKVKPKLEIMNKEKCYV